MQISNQVVVITGATKGLGKSLALAFSSAGATVVISARKDDELQKAATETGAMAIVCDVTKEADVKHLAEEVIKKYGRIDIWINNAGIWVPHASVEETDWQKVHDMVEVNLFGTVYGSKAALVQMRQQNSGSIINILSTIALDGRAMSSGYCASKYATVGFTKSLRKEVEGADIKVFSIYPGGMQTNFFDEKKPDDIDQYMHPDFVADNILKNLQLEEPEDELIIKRPAA